MPGGRHQARHRAGLEKWLELNREYSEKWPNITSKKEAPADADKFRDEKENSRNISSKSPGPATKLDPILSSVSPLHCSKIYRSTPW